jgi:hypothetical protein
MQFKTLLVALSLAISITASALPEPQLEARAASAPFQIRRFTPLANFNPADTTTWSNNEYTNIASANAIFNYNGVTAAEAYKWTFDNTTGTLRGSPSGSGGLVPRNLQSYSITVTPVVFGGAGDPVIVTIGPAPLYEVKFQTTRSGAGVAGWTGFSQIGGYVFLGKASDISAPVRFRAIGYTA